MLKQMDKKIFTIYDQNFLCINKTKIYYKIEIVPNDLACGKSGGAGIMTSGTAGVSSNKFPAPSNSSPTNIQYIENLTRVLPATHHLQTYNI